MEAINIWSELLKMGVVFVLMGLAVLYLHNQTKAKEKKIESLEDELKDYSKDYNSLANNSLKVLTLVDDKLKSDNQGNEINKDIHRIVLEILELEKSRRSAS